MPGIIETFGIESPIVKLVLYQGIVLTALVLLAIGLFFGELVRWSRPGIVVPVLAFVTIINTFESIASKSTMVAKVAIMMLVLFRPQWLTQRLGLARTSKNAPSVLDGTGLPSPALRLQQTTTPKVC